MKLNKRTKLYEVNCKKCRKTYYYVNLKYARLQYPHCLTCRNGHVVYYDKKKELYYDYCKICGIKRYSKKESTAIAKMRNPRTIGCNNCKGARIGQNNLKYDSAYLEAHKIVQDRKGIYHLECPHGHKRTAKTVFRAVCLKDGRGRCSECETIRRNKENAIKFPSMAGEVWKPVKGYDGYQVSTFGRVKNRQGRVLKPQVVSQKRYHGYSLFNDKGNFWNYAHRLVGIAFIPNPHKYAEVDHYPDPDHFNNHVSNLRWTTHHDNILEARARGAWPLIVTNNKLTEANVRHIRRHPDKRPEYWMKKYGLSKSCIYKVRAGRTWNHVAL